MKPVYMTFEVVSSNGIRVVDAFGCMHEGSKIEAEDLLKKTKSIIREQSVKHYHENPERITLMNAVVKDV